jgi:probable F420-dependent oxidoreductase
MRIGVCIPTYDRYGDGAVQRDLIVEAERLGFDSVWFGDHILVPSYATKQTDPHWYDAVSTAIFGAGLTSKIAFGTDVLVAPYRDPILLAKMAATASELSNGRLMLGLGVGYLKGEFDALGIPPYERRGAVTDEYLRVMRLLFETRGPVAFDGEWVKFSEVEFGPVPAIAPPLLVGGNHDRALERAARLGDGWHPLFASPEVYARGHARITEIRQSEGITRPFTFSYSCPQTRLLAAGEPMPAAFVQNTEDAPADYDYVPDTGRAPDGRQRFIGTAAQLHDDIAAFAAAGVDQMVLRFAMSWDDEVPPDKIGAQWQAFAEQVMPAVRSR